MRMATLSTKYTGRPGIAFLATTCLLAALALASGCSAQQRASLGNNDPVQAGSGAEGSATDPTPEADSGPACPSANLTRACQCPTQSGNLPGRQTCYGAGIWGPCECSGASSTIIGSGGETGDPSANRGTALFEWERTRPEGGDCTAGVYRGDFTCEIDTSGGLFPPGVVTGPIEFTLEESANGEFLVLSEGTLVGLTTFGLNFSCNLEGTLDCSTNLFHAEAVDGVYGVPPFGGTFGGTLDAQLNRVTQTLNGEWALAEHGAYASIPCIGPWSAVLQP